MNIANEKETFFLDGFFDQRSQRSGNNLKDSTEH
jgi:hypothetical protein